MPTNQSKVVKIVMVGIGGYGYYYLKTYFEECDTQRIKLSGVVDQFPDNSGYFDELNKREIPIYKSLEKFYKDGNTAHLVVICSPIQYHFAQCHLALRNGSNVLLEKPIGATVQEALELINEEQKSGKWVMIGYQWSYSSAIQALKKDIIKGGFGRPIRLKSLCFWPRTFDYYQRNNWAGVINDDQGNYVLDSPANNANAHFLHNLFYLLGEKIDLSAQPREVTAELYRAYSIENFDTVACRIQTTAGVELLFYASHVTHKQLGPIFELEFEAATIILDDEKKEIIAFNNNGRQTNYGDPDSDNQFLKLFDAIESVYSPKQVICGLEASLSQTICINGIQDSVPEISKFDESGIVNDGQEKRLWVKDLDSELFQCYQKNILPCEAYYDWAIKGRTIDLKDYKYFPGGVQLVNS